jgi:hypothetical protein
MSDSWSSREPSHPSSKWQSRKSGFMGSHLACSLSQFFSCSCGLMGTVRAEGERPEPGPPARVGLNLIVSHDSTSSSRLYHAGPNSPSSTSAAAPSSRCMVWC